MVNRNRIVLFLWILFLITGQALANSNRQFCQDLLTDPFLPPPSRKIARSDYHFSRREVREFSGWTDFQVRMHLERLNQMEYVLTHRGRRGQSFEYELLYSGEGANGHKFVMGLLEVETLRNNAPKFEGFEHNFEVQNGKFEPSWSGQSGPNEGVARGQFTGCQAALAADREPISAQNGQNAYPVYAR